MTQFPRRYYRGSALTAGLVALLLTTASCSDDNGGGSGKSTESVSLSVVGPITSLDPVKAVSFQDLQAASAAYSPLVYFSPDGKLISGLAESWESTATSATFKIRTGVTCSDGEKLTPAVVAASLKRYMDPASNAPLRGRVAGSGNTATVTADDSAGTVTIKLANPWSELVAGMTSPSTGIVCSSGLKDPKSLRTKTAGTGPFVAASQVPGATYTFSSRSGYSWGPTYDKQPSGKVPAKLVLTVIKDDNTAANLQNTKALSIASYTTQAWHQFEDKAGFTTESQAQSDTMLLFNETPGHPTADESVRRAIAQALDRNTLTKVLGDGHGTIEQNLGDPNYLCYDESLQSAIPEHDPSAAAALKGVKIKIVGTTLVASGNGTSSVLSQLNEAGASATLSNMHNEAWVDALFSGKNDWDVTILVYANTFNSLTSAAGFFVADAPPKGQNIGGVKNAAAADAYAKAGALTGDAKCAATTALQREFFGSVDVLPLAAVPVTNVFTNNVQAVLVKGFAMPSSIRVAD